VEQRSKGQGKKEPLELLRSHNLRVTPQRLEILKQIQRTEDHPSATELHRRVRRKFPNISLDTVARTLEQFAKIGICRWVEGYDDVRRYDGMMERHHHFHCIRCKRILDVRPEALEEPPLPSLRDERFKVIDFRILLEGICKKCMERQQDP
jgi:Fur family peroxide stress response transcriptional regulator